jgi:hypothetical protein
MKKKMKSIEVDNRIWSLPQYHDKEKFDNMFKLAKQEYPDELDYILHLTCLSTLMEIDENKNISYY